MDVRSRFLGSPRSGDGWQHMVLEGLVTTLNPDGSVNLAPMGPLVDAEMKQFALRPYRTSSTFANLNRTRQGVLHVTDNVLMMAMAAIGELDPLPEMVPAGRIEGMVIADACRWYEFRVTHVQDQAARTTLSCRVVDSGRIRDFFGFNRAKHAVIESAILATRLDYLPRQQVDQDLEWLSVLVDKTAGSQERQAFDLVRAYIHQQQLDRMPSGA